MLNVGYGNLGRPRGARGRDRVAAVRADAAAARGGGRAASWSTPPRAGARARSSSLDSDHVVLSAVNPETIAARLASGEDERGGVSARRGIPFVVSAPSGTGKTTVCRGSWSAIPARASRSRTPRAAARPGERDGRRLPLRRRARVRAPGRGGRLPRARRVRRATSTARAARRSTRRSARAATCSSRSRCRARASCASGRPDARLVFLLPPSLDELEQRLRGRGTDAPEAVERRLELARRELAARARSSTTRS